MPVYLRNWYIRELTDIKKREAEASQGKNSSTSPDGLRIPKEAYNPQNFKPQVK